MDKCGLLLPGESRRMVVESAEELAALEAAQFGCIGALITSPYKNVLSISTLLEVREIRRRKIGAQIDVLAVGRVHIERVESKGGRYFVARGCRPAVDERAQDEDAEFEGLVLELRAAAARHEALRIGLTKAVVSTQTRDEIAARLPKGWTGTTPHYPNKGWTTPHYPNKGEAMEGARPEDGTTFSRPQPSQQQDRDQPKQQRDLQEHHHHHHQQQQQQQALEPLERWVYKPAAWQQQQEQQQQRQPQPLQPPPPPQPLPPPPQQQPLDEAREQMFEELCSYQLDQAPATTLERLYGLWGVEDEASAEVQMLSFAACTSLPAFQRSLALGKLKTSERLEYVRSCVERAASHLAAKAAIRSAFASA